MIERHQSSESLARTPAKSLETVERGQRKLKIFLYVCAWASREEKQVVMQKVMEIGRGKLCYILPMEGGVTSLHCPEEQTALHLWTVKGI